MKVNEVMTSGVVSITTSTPFRTIVELMTTWRISGLPVTDYESRVIGIVTEGDLIVKGHRGEPVRFGPIAVTQHKRRREFTRRAEGCVAGELMTSPAITIDEDADVTAAACLMTRHAIGRLPVTKAGKLSGIVSRADVLKAFLRDDDELRREVEDDILGRKVEADTGEVLVHVAEGVVTLRGRVEHRSTAQVIEFHLDRLTGVTHVVDELSYRIDDTRSVAETLPALGPAEMSV